MSDQLEEIPQEDTELAAKNETTAQDETNKTTTAEDEQEEKGEDEGEKPAKKVKKVKKEEVKKKNAIPTRLAALADLGISVSKAWAINHPTFTVKFTDYQSLLNQAQTYSDSLGISQNYDGEKTTNTDALKDLNKRLTNALRMLKNYIKAEYDSPIAAKAAYIKHGLVELSENSYGLPRDNDARQKCLLKLVAVLQEAGNPFAGKTYGLSAWQLLQTEHQTVWNASQNTRMGKSSITNNTDLAYKELRNMLVKLRAQIKIDFDGQDVNKILRTFSFMKENV